MFCGLAHHDTEPKGADHIEQGKIAKQEAKTSGGEVMVGGALLVGKCPGKYDEAFPSVSHSSRSVGGGGGSGGGGVKHVNS